MIGYEMIRTPDKRPTNHMSDNMSDFLHTRNTSSHVNIYNTVNTAQNNFEGSTWFVQVVIWGQFLHLRQFLQVLLPTEIEPGPWRNRALKFGRKYISEVGRKSP